MIKIYNEGYYTVVEVNDDQFDKINKFLLYSLLHPNKDNVKILLGNDIEQEYLSEILDIEPSNLKYADYYKVVKV